MLFKSIHNLLEWEALDCPLNTLTSQGAAVHSFFLGDKLQNVLDVNVKDVMIERNVRKHCGEFLTNRVSFSPYQY